MSADPRPNASTGTAPSGDGLGCLVLAPGGRPLPDYELVRKVGEGGFGEVWEALGLAGSGVALKFVRLAEGAPSSELRALEYMKGIRHPHLLPVFGAWQRDGRLVIALELADGSLADRLKEARRQGHEGIPPPELAEYLREAAKGLDHLNERRHPSASGEAVGIQHKDVKPANLLLVGGSVKVADFGLAKLMEHTVSQASGGMTPSYAAPEFLKGQATRRSDQYCLAVTYCHLRGGRLPFAGNVHEVLSGHLMREPDLGMVPQAERAAVARALSKKPEERWGSCGEFAEAVGAAVRGRVSPPVAELADERTLDGEARLEKLLRAALERGEGRLRDADRTQVSRFCREHGIGAGRANAIARQVRERRKQMPPPLPREGQTEPAAREPEPERTRRGVSRRVALGGLVAAGGVLAGFGYWAFRGPPAQLPKKERRAGEVIQNTLGMKFAWCPPGTFLMGSPADEEKRESDETRHRVTLTKGF